MCRISSATASGHVDTNSWLNYAVSFWQIRCSRNFAVLVLLSFQWSLVSVILLSFEERNCLKQK